jgi:hypothetical protein
MMITITTTNDAPLRFNVHVAGVAAYLDNFTLIELAKPSEAARRDRHEEQRLAVILGYERNRAGRLEGRLRIECSRIPRWLRRSLGVR